MDFYDGVRLVHIMSGTVALATFWTAAFLRKGSSNHRRVGRTYLIAMVVIMLTAVPLALHAFAQGNAVVGTFLLYLIVITGTPTWLAWRAIRDKQSFKAFTGPVYRALAGLNLIAGAIVFYFGLRFDTFLLIGFSAVGALGGVFMLRYALIPQTDRMWYLSRHYGAIIGCGVATHVAFLNLGLSRLVPPEWHTAVLNFSFFGPLSVSLVARWWLHRKYRRNPSSLSARPPVAVNYAPPRPAMLDNGRLTCSSFDSSPGAFAKAIATTASSMEPKRALRPAAPSR